MALTAGQTAAALALTEAFAQAAEDLKAEAAAAAESAWLGFDAWFTPVAVAALAAETSKLSDSMQDQMAGLSAQFVADVASTMTGGRRPVMPRSVATAIRNGAPLKRVHTRPAQVYLRSIGLGQDNQTALSRAIGRAADTMRSDLTLQERQSQQVMLERLGIVTFRRVIHPELSVSGTCGLCVAASDRKYKTGDLMPMHFPTCKCTVMPVIGDNDPGLELNENDIGQLYADAGSTKAADLRRTRYVVHEHGEFGPMLAKVDDNFRDESQSRLEDDPARAARMLAQALPTLSQVEAKHESGKVTDAQLDYQRNLVAKLQRIAGSQAAA